MKYKISFQFWCDFFQHLTAMINQKHKADAVQIITSKQPVTHTEFWSTAGNIHNHTNYAVDD